MKISFSNEQITDFETVLSAPRFATYLREADGDRQLAMDLYLWNTEVSCAFFLEIQFCELAIRNAAVEALEIEFGDNWHLSKGFAHTLPTLRKGRGYQPKTDLITCAEKLATSGKVVAELKLAFWQHLFVVGQDRRLWMPHFHEIFPEYDKQLSIQQARASIHEDIRQIRFLRNRIAHHEPIFKRNLLEDQIRLKRVISWRRTSIAIWIESYEKVTELLSSKPA
jgi:hypothetical protein